MTGRDAFPIAPPSIGEVLADASAWQAWALSVPAQASSPRVRRPRRVQRSVATLAAVVAAAAMSLAGCASGAHAAVRPVWNGRTPHVWTSEADPLCAARYVGRHGWIQVDGHGTRFRAECQRDGRVDAWSIVSGGTR